MFVAAITAILPLQLPLASVCRTYDFTHEYIP